MTRVTDFRFKDLSAHALRLRLYAGPLDWPEVTVFSRDRAVGGDIEIDASVIGSSHVMEVRSGTLALTELLACEAPSSAQPLAFWRPGDAAIEYAARGQLRYRFAASVLERNDSSAELSQLRQLVRDAGRSPVEVGLAYRFPSAVNGPWTAETLVWASAKPRGVIARTAHSYPSEGLVVLSSTSIQIAAAIRDPVEPELALAV